MDEEERNEMLEADDKYESYKLGYKRGHDRGSEFVRQQSRSEIAGLNAALRKRDEQIDQLSDEITAQGRHVKDLQSIVEVNESLLKIAHNDINAFLHSEDRMKVEIRDLNARIDHLVSATQDIHQKRIDRGDIEEDGLIYTKRGYRG